MASKDAPVLAEMYKEWPFLYTNMDLVDMILAKADVEIAENYDLLLVTDAEQKKLGVELRNKLQVSKHTPLKVCVCVCV
jgi:phosphoenolpyruvate carboxylase